MPADTASRLTKRLLDASLRELETEAVGARYNTFCIRALASAAAVLNVTDVADRALQLLRAAPDSAFWAGMITNIELPKIVPERLRTVDPSEDLEKQHPPYRQEKIVGGIQSCEKTEAHLGLCLEGRIEEARSKAGAGLKLEEVGETFAVLGEFDTALSIARDPALERFRQLGVLLVLVIEFFRKGRIENSEALLAELEPGLGAWDRIHLALGFSGREPWCGYPFPDW